MSQRLPIQIAIDGPAGAGKSTIAKGVAARLGIAYLDTGAMYRAVGLKALRLGVSTHDEAAVCAMAQGASVEVRLQDGAQRVLLDGLDVSDAIRTPEVSMAASDVSRFAPVRARLVALQRQIAGQIDVVLDGRDIGTVVLPGAQFKFYVTASVQVRAQRRLLELRQKGKDLPLQAVIDDIASRDHQDSTRAASPLAVAADAQILDTSDLSIEQAIAHVVERVRTTE